MNFMNKIVNDINKRNKILIKKINKIDKSLLVLLISVIGILSISKVVVQATSTPKGTPGTRTVMKYDIKNRVTGKFVYNKKGYLYESRIYNPETKKLKALRYFYKNTGRMNSIRRYNANGKLQRFDAWYNVKNRKQKLGEKAHSVVYDTKVKNTKSKKIVKEIGYTTKGKAKAVGKFIEPIKRGKSSITSGYGSGRNHTGIDMAYSSGGITAGKPIYAANSGTVVTVEKHSDAGYGHYVVIDHGNGVRTLYGHMSSVDVHKGQIIWKNEKIGTIGTTGISTGPHVHFEYRKENQPINGIDYIRRAVFYKR